MRLCKILAGVALAIPSIAADAPVVEEVQLLFATGVWDRALEILEKEPSAETDPTLKQLRAMAYLYTSSRLDMSENLAKARTLSKAIVEGGGKARFLVGLGRDLKREKYLVEATPGELVVSKTAVEFVPRVGVPKESQTWQISELTGCSTISLGYGASNNSFLLRASGKDREYYFRPLQNSAEESGLICSLIGVPAGAEASAPKEKEKEKDKEQDKDKKKKGNK